MSGDVLPDETWKQVKEVFEHALKHPSGGRAAAVAAATPDSTVRNEVLALLEAHDETGDFLEEPALLAEKHQLGPYTILEHIGGGGMGEIYRARDTRLSRDVAIKMLRSPNRDPASRARFEREARAIAALSHPNVLEIYDVGETGGSPFLVTELLGGRSLREHLAGGRLTVTVALDWAKQIARGLAAAHQQGLVHRDLKPENVFVLEDGRVKILDFGLARPLTGLEGGGTDTGTGHIGHTTPGAVLGTVGYLAPEQARGQPITASADLFALGATLYEMLTGARAFRGDTPLDTLAAVIDGEVPPPSSRNPDVPSWLDRIVDRCLAKEVVSRFESARDLEFALGAEDTPAPPPVEPVSRTRWLLLVASALVALAVGFAVASATRSAVRPALSVDERPEPLRPTTFSNSGSDQAPTASPDGRFVAFASDRDGRSRIWLHQVETGREIALTEGPDSEPRFSHDGSQLLFARSTETGVSLYRVPLLGGDARRLIDDATGGDWSPSGRELAFVRWHDDGAGTRPTLMLAAVDGSDQRALASLDYRDRVQPRWSPDGRTVAVTGLSQLPGARQLVTLVPVDGSPIRLLEAPNRIGLVSSVAWHGIDSVIYSQALSVVGNSVGSNAQIVRQRIADGATTTLLWTRESSLVLDRWPGRGVVFDARSSRQNLHELRPKTGHSVYLSRGTGSDRQPALSPDDKSVIFSSNRGSNLDIWSIERETGTLRRLTDDPGDDWDPAYTPDGEHILWSSSRTGYFEVWMAEKDGSNPRRITDDGDAENPTATPDGSWIVHASGVPGRRGVWRIRPDGSDAALVVADGILPEVSPDGVHVLFQRKRSPRIAIVGVAEIATGRVLPFEIEIVIHKETPAILGRARWMPGGNAIAFSSQTADGANGIHVQRFALEGDTSETRVPLVGFGEESIAESFDVSDDVVIVAEWKQRSEIVAAQGYLAAH